jgi:hypothetical protein
VGLVSSRLISYPTLIAPPMTLFDKSIKTCCEIVVTLGQKSMMGNGGINYLA